MENQILNREQNATLDFHLMSSPLLMSTKCIGEQELSDFLEAFLDSCSLFGQSELYYRTKGRIENSTGEQDLIDYYAGLGQQYNQKGIDVLTIAINDFQEYVNNLPPNPPHPPADFSNFVQESKFFYEGLEIKPVDVTKLINVLNETVNAGTPSEIELYNYILSKANELKTVRQSPDRGAVDNIPWWKIVAIAVIIGIAALEIWRCIFRNRCSKTEKAAYKAGYTIAGLVLKFC
ncbi:MAG: hypothetical protein Q8K70_08055 [Bacteroidota bacterium]|nr:hypothetical protein [Bacteroidota bacterium]